MVRESHERTGREVEACQGRIETLRGRVAELEREVDKAWQAHAVVDSEMEVRHLCSVLHVVFQRVQGGVMDCTSCKLRHLKARSSLRGRLTRKQTSNRRYSAAYVHQNLLLRAAKEPSTLRAAYLG